LVLLTAVGSLRIAAGAPNDGLLATQFSMFGKQLWALPTSEFERRGSGGGGEENLACEPEREAELLREARRLIQSVPREPGPRRRLVCFRAYTGRHLYRIREGQRGIWHRLRPFFFDRLYARTLLRDSSFIRFGGLLEDSWHGRVVHVVGSMGANDVFNAVILEDAAPATGGAATRERARVTDPRHLRATRNGI
jgi:hypothetical protein